MPRLPHYTVGQLAREKGVPPWKMRRVVDGLPFDVPRAGLYRLIPCDRLDEIDAELRKQGWLPTDEEPGEQNGEEIPGEQNENA